MQRGFMGLFNRLFNKKKELEYWVEKSEVHTEDYLESEFQNLITSGRLPDNLKNRAAEAEICGEKLVPNWNSAVDLIKLSSKTDPVIREKIRGTYGMVDNGKPHSKTNYRDRILPKE
ncbi:MAG: hypothetical protein QM613_04480 [Micrococcaceae bacterium]